ISTKASGSRWTRCATSTCWKSCGPTVTLLGSTGTDAMTIDAAFWKGKRVLLTGHTGFKGSWLSLWLQSIGAQVHGYALKAPTQPSLFEEAQVCEGMTSTIADVRDRDA